MVSRCWDVAEPVTLTAAGWPCGWALASQVLCHVSSELPQRVSSVRKTLSRAEQAHLQKRCPRIALVIDGARRPLVGVRSPSALGPVQLKARRDAAGVRAPGHGHVRGQADVLLR